MASVWIRRMASRPRATWLSLSIKNYIYLIFILSSLMAIFAVRVLPQKPLRPNARDTVKYYRATASDFARQATYLADVASDGTESNAYRSCVAAVRADWYKREADWYSKRAVELEASNNYNHNTEMMILESHQRKAGLALTQAVASGCEL